MWIGLLTNTHLRLGDAQDPQPQIVTVVPSNFVRVKLPLSL